MSQHMIRTHMEDELRHTQQSLMATLNQAAEKELYHHASEGVWSLAEVLAHVINARESFIRDALRVVASPNSSMGRTIQDAGRLAAVREHGSDSAEALRKGLIRSHAELMEGLEKITDTELQITGEHVSPKFGRQTLAEFVQHFIVEHEQNHVKQAQHCLARTRP